MRRLLAAAALSCLAWPAFAQVDVTNAWVRPTVEGQMGTGAFMTLRAKEPMRVVGATSAVAGVVEIHEMALQNNVMRMRAIESLALPAGQAVELKPGGYHVMLMDLKRALKRGETVTVELQLETADKRRVTQPIQVEVRSSAPGAEAKK
jgi:copper(I)-binding protein